ncbi:MAG: response regulator [Verrucomicrobia bacterium]|nr:response regulator [Verrucomicrobiota bacterium]
MKERILVVDDEAPIRDLLQALFMRHGYGVSGAATAGEALRALDESGFDLLVLDIALEDADGLELLTSIRQAHPSLPVIMLTGMGYDQELETEALTRGAQGYVSKTLPPDQLLMEVHRVLRHSGANAPAEKEGPA